MTTGTPQPPPAPPTTPAAAPIIRLIEQPDDLAALARQLAGQARIAVDSESDSFHHYHEKVCLLQISIPGETFLVDPLRLDRLDPLLPLFADPAVEKVLHGADYDIRTLGRDYAITFTNLFDTMIAAQLIGLEAFGLAALLKSHFDITLNKQWQKADWSARPLTPAMIRYAADDTAHLFALRDRLADGLAHKGRLEWLREECRLLTAQKAAARQPPSCFAVKGAGRLEPQQQAILQALLEAREAIASTTDRPPFKIITNETLMELSVRQPAAIEQLAAMPGVGRRALQQWGAGLLEAIRCGAAVPPEQRPRRAASRYVSLTGAQDAMLKRMKTAREEAATRLGISPGLLCSNAVMEELTRLSQPTAAQLAQRLTQWRYEIMGDTFLKMLAGPNSM